MYRHKRLLHPCASRTPEILAFRYDDEPSSSFGSGRRWPSSSVGSSRPPPHQGVHSGASEDVASELGRTTPRDGGAVHGRVCRGGHWHTPRPGT